jgi:hypothetical protein
MREKGQIRGKFSETRPKEYDAAARDSRGRAITVKKSVGEFAAKPNLDSLLLRQFARNNALLLHSGRP